MKRNLRVLLLFLTLSVFAFTQQKVATTDIPPVVSKQFNSLFPDGKEEIWAKDRGFNYHVSFKYNNFTTIVLFDEFGNVLQNETIVSVDDLSKKATKYININFPTYKIERVSKNESGKDIFYFVQISKEVTNSLRLIFDIDGNYIKTLYE